jgi:hypothetical protein
MAYIGYIEGSPEMACGAPKPSFNRIQGAKLINAADIASFTVLPGGAATITRVSTKVGYGITTVNNALTLTVGIKSQDIMPGAFDVTITFKQFGLSSLSGVSSTGEVLGIVNRLARAELVFAIDHGNGVYRVYGLGAPLVCLEYSLDSTADGYALFTYGVEDWQVGTTIHTLTKADYDALSTPAT